MATILVIDDEQKVRTVICSLLASQHIVIEARNGKEGLFMYTKFLPDLIITDLNMPVVTGLEVVRSVRSIRNSKPVKIIGLAASFSSSKACSVMLEAGADVCLPKPTPTEKIRDAVTRLLAA
ncbi:MAG: response regulator [Blastocatellia bacterium]|nr:response regulator [Blastocatellia bacterium]